MKRTLLITFSTLLFMNFHSQNLKPIAKKVKEHQVSGKQFIKYNLFSKDESVEKQHAYQAAAKDITVLQLKKSELQRIITEKPETLEMSFPFENQYITVELVKNSIFADGFKVNTDKGFVNYTPGVYYYGIIQGDEKSVVAFSFFDNDIVGVASKSGLGNIILGKTKNSESFVSYNDLKLTKGNPFVCGFDELAENQKMKNSYQTEMLKQNKKTTNCVRVYYEVCRAPYIQNGSNTTTTTNWLTAIHNNIATLYTNDNVLTAISEIFIWTTTDPYNGSYNQNLNNFRINRPVFNGDLAHLVNYPSTTSVAYMNSLCGSYKYAYSGIDKNFNNVPTYSWTVGAMAHEMGHSLGSPHTHACNWNGNDTAIDGCGAQAGYSEGCDGPIPSNGGTIMSYCHFFTGIDFTQGFGPQPAALIRNTVDSKGCLGTGCTTSCTTTVTTINYSNVTANSATVTFTDNVSSTWKYKVIKYDGTLISSGNTTSKTINITGLSAGTYYRVFVGTDCSGPNAYQNDILFLTDADWCSGVLFTDTGGETGYYDENQTIIKTFYPSSPANQRLVMTFSEFDLEPADSSTGEIYDYMTIYDGTSTSAPVFSGGNQIYGNTIPGPFTATNPQGAITVKFVSDSGLEHPGWKASFQCAFMATNETNVNNSIDISPNPTKGNITITSSDKILKYSVSDSSGRKILNSSKTEVKNPSIHLEKYPAGTYLVTVETEKTTITKKVIKY